MALVAFAPVFRTADLERSVRFYVEALGFVSEQRVAGSTNLYHGAVRIILSQPDPKEEWKGPSFTGHLYIGVDSLDELDTLWARVKDRAKIIFALKDLDYGAREFCIEDDNGYRLLFGALLPKKK
jgi:uncharacterized glyoxalase superfamily protein PhnB